MKFNENDLLRDKTELLNLRLSKLPSTKVLLKLEFDTEDQVLFRLRSNGGLNHVTSRFLFPFFFWGWGFWWFGGGGSNFNL